MIAVATSCSRIFLTLKRPPCYLWSEISRAPAGPWWLENARPTNQHRDLPINAMNDGIGK
jgi:hypothetical protein